jgi:Abnormal spindle-like microcephaly-assoc'd, ASPM-SPD-2-Hydin
LVPADCNDCAILFSFPFFSHPDNILGQHGVVSARNGCKMIAASRLEATPPTSSRRRISVSATKNLSTLFSRFTENDFHSKKDLRSHFLGTIGCAVLAIFLLMTAGLACAQTPMAYDFLGRSEDFGTINLTTGVFSQTGNSGLLLSGLGVGPGGLLYGGYYGGATLYQVNPANGSLTSIGTGTFDYVEFGSTTSGVYGFDGSLNLFSINTTTGADTLIGSMGLVVAGTTGASTGSDTLYFTNGSPAILYSINTTTAAPTEIGNTGVSDIGAMVFENGTLYAGSNGSPVSLYTLDTATGAATLVADAPSSADFWGLAPSVFPVVGLSPASLKLASTVVGQTSAASTLTLTNSGSFSISISTVSVSGDFSETDSCAGQTILPGGTCTVSVTFTPSVTGSIAGALTITDNALNTPQVLALSGTGLAELSVSPASENFGTVTVGTTSAPKTMTLTNNTSGTLDYTFLTSSNYSVVGSGKSPCNGGLAKKAKCTVSVTFTPSANGAADGSLAVSSASFPTELAALSGTGSGGGTAPLTFSPATFKVANTLVGASSSPVTVTVTNSSAATVNITNFVASADYSVIGSGSTPCSGALGAGDSCTVAVTFSPSIAGKLDGSVVFMDNASVNTQLYDLSATAVLPVTFAPASLTFASQALGKTSAAKSITLTNNQAATLDLTGIAASGQFSAAPGGKKPCGSTVSAHGTCTFEVTFTPAQAGTIPGAVTVTSNASSSPQNIKLSGTGQ